MKNISFKNLILPLAVSAVFFITAFFSLPHIISLIKPADGMNMMSYRMTGVFDISMRFSLAAALVPLLCFIFIKLNASLSTTKKTLAVAVILLSCTAGILIRALMLRTMISYRNDFLEAADQSVRSYISIDDLSFGWSVLLGALAGFILSFFLFRKKTIKTVSV